MKRLLHCLAGLSIGMMSSTAALGNPQGAQVIHGQVNFNHPDPATLNVTSSHGAIINWQQFSIQQNETTRFIQDSAASAVLNRVVSQHPSDILGQLLSNGRVFLINPNGIVFGKNSVVDTAGLIASTLDMTDEDFINGKLRFQGDNAAAIQNMGYIKAGAKGDIFLIAPNIENSGIIETEAGEIILAAGESLTIASLDSDHIVFDVQAPENEAVNLGQIITNGGAAKMFAATIRHSGSINADSIDVDAQGRVVLSAAHDTYLEGASIISAGGTEGGRVEVLGERVALVDEALIDVSGETAGGEVLIGGDYQGGNPEVRNARRSYIGHDTMIKANALGAGDGGKVIVWADETTQFYGDISARGGSDAGNGGFVETSGRHYLEALGQVDASAVKGDSGEWLLDPIDVSIGVADIAGSLSKGIWTPAASGSTIANTTIESALAGGTSVTVTTTGALAEAGDITISAALSQTAASAARLTLKADNDINVNAGIGTAGARFNHDFILRAGNRIGVNSPIYLANNLFSATAPTIAVDALTDVGSGVVRLRATSTATQSSAIIAGELELLGGGGAHTLTHAGNQFGSVKMDTGSVILSNNGTTTINGLLAPGAGQESVVTAVIPAANEFLGASIDVNGDVMVVGAPGTFMSGQGAAYVYRWNGSNWVFETRLSVAGTINFGQSVTVEGTHIVVGAPETHDGGFRQGVAYPFEWNGANWVQGSKLSFTSPGFESNFGWSMAIENDRLVVGGARNATDIAWSGRLWFFDLVAGSWVEQGSLGNPAPVFNDFFGFTLDISGDQLIAGSANRSGQAGEARIFEFNSMTRLWDEQQQLTLGVGGDFFGSNVSIDDDIAIIAKTPNGSAGDVYIYRFNGANWAPEQTITASDVVAGDQFGHAVRVRDGVIIASSARADLPGNVDAGAGYVFEHNGATWVEDSKVTASTPAAGDWFGITTTLADQRVFFGAQFADPGGQGSAGAAYAYEALDTGATLSAGLAITADDIILSTALDVGTTLDLQAANDITLNPGAEIVTLGGGGGDINMTAGNNVTINAEFGSVANFFEHDLFITAGNAININAGLYLQNNAGFPNDLARLFADQAVNLGATGLININDTDPAESFGVVRIHASDPGAFINMDPAFSITHSGLFSPGALLELRADDMLLDGSIDAANIGVSLQTYNAGREIDLGSNSAGKLGLTNLELDNISADDIRVGRFDSGKVTVTSPINLSDTSELLILVRSDIEIQPGTGITMPNLLLLEAQDVDIQASLISTSGDIIMQTPFAVATDIELGTAGPGAGVLALEQSEIDLISVAGQLQIGSFSQNDITVTGAMDFAVNTLLQSQDSIFINDSLTIPGFTLTPGTDPGDAVVIGGSGVLAGAGTVNGDLTSSGTLLAGSSPGVINITGDLLLNPSSVIGIELAGLVQGTQYDFINVSGNMTLDGTLNVSEIDGFITTVGDMFTVMACAGGPACRSGSFTTLNPSFGDSYNLPIEQSTSVLLDIVGTNLLLSWDGGAGNLLWQDPINWTTDTLPDGSTDLIIGTAAGDIIISSAGQAGNVLNSNVNIRILGGDLSINNAFDINATLEINGGDFIANGDGSVNTLMLTSGTLSGSGDVRVSGLTTWDDGVMSGSGTTFADGGIDLAGSFGNRAINRNVEHSGTRTWSPGGSIPGTGTLTHQSGTLTMTTRFFIDSPFVNNGTVIVDLSAVPNPNKLIGFDSVFNEGTFQINDGTFRIDDTSSSTTGSYAIAAGAKLLIRDDYSFNSGSISGAGTLELEGSDFDVAGGTINLSGLSLLSASTFDSMGGSTSILGSAIDATSTLRISSAGTFSPSGAVNNNGLIDLNAGSLLLPANSNHNSGTFAAASGAIVDFTGGTHGFFGTVNLQGNGTFEINGGTILVSNVLNLLPGATLKLSGDAIGGAGTINSDGAIIAEGLNAFLGSLVSNSPLTVQATAGSGDASLNVVNLTTDGQLSLSNLDSSVGRNATINAAASFTNKGNFDIFDLNGMGTLTLESQLITNSASASINIQSGGSVIFDGGVAGTGFLANNGNIVISGTNLTASDFSQVNNDGSFSIASGRQYSQTGVSSFFTNNNLFIANSGVLSVPDFQQIGGLTTLNGASAILASVNGVGITGGSLRGSGQILTPTVNHNGGVLQPGASPGTLSISGNYIMGPGATLETELGGLSQGINYDLLSVAGSATLDGILDIQFFGGFTGNLGDQFDIISASNLLNDFVTINEPSGYTFLASANTPTSGIYQLEINSAPTVVLPPAMPSSPIPNETLVDISSAQLIVLNDYQKDVAAAGASVETDEDDDEDKRELVCR